MNLTDLMHINSSDQLENLNQDTYLNLPFHFYWKDKDGNYLGCNDTQARFGGLEKGSDLLGFSDFDMCWASYASVYQHNEKNIMQDQQAKFLIEPIIDKNNYSIIMLSYKFPLRMKSRHKIIGVAGASFFFEKKELFGDLLKYTDIDNKDSNIYLTNRQVDCLYYLIKGMTIKQIAKKINLSPRTVEHYLESLKEKFKCIDRTDLISRGLRLSVIKYRLLIDS